MRFALLGVSLMVLAGCNQSPAPSGSGPKSPGRFAGIGVFEAGRLWGQMAGSPAAKDATSAKLQDDEHIIVVMDSHTGEVRQCGDHSGFCVSMNPWAGEGSRMLLPVKLNKHAADLAAEDRAAMEDTSTATNGSAPAQ